MTERAEILLQRLGLAYRVLLMSTREMGFTQARKYDLEVWSPGVERWLEVSSCSNFRDFQARRMAIRYRPEPGAKPELVHTLNGSGSRPRPDRGRAPRDLPAAGRLDRGPRGAPALPGPRRDREGLTAPLVRSSASARQPPQPGRRPQGCSRQLDDPAFRQPWRAVPAVKRDHDGTDQGRRPERVIAKDLVDPEMRLPPATSGSRPQAGQGRPVTRLNGQHDGRSRRTAPAGRAAPATRIAAIPRRSITCGGAVDPRNRRACPWR